MRVQIVSFHCVLKDKLGQVISSSFNHDVVTTASADDPSTHSLPGLVEGLRGLKEGEKKRISVKADQAYGYYDPKLQIEVTRSSLERGKSLKVGDMVSSSQGPDGVLRTYRVVSADRLKLTLEGNHPLAGQDLVFDVEVTSAREETEALEQTRLVQ